MRRREESRWWNSGEDDSLKGILRKWVLGMNRRKSRLDIKCHEGRKNFMKE